MLMGAELATYFSLIECGGCDGLGEAIKKDTAEKWNSALLG